MGDLHLMQKPMRVSPKVLERAGKDRIAIALANLLLAEGFRITGIQTEGCCYPVIWVTQDLRLAIAVDNDEADYYHSGFDSEGYYRIGQLKRNGALIKWLERRGRTQWWRH